MSNVAPAQFPNPMNYPGESPELLEQEPKRSKRRLSKKGSSIAEQHLRQNPSMTLIELKSRVDILDAQAHRFEFQVKSIRDEIPSCLFARMMADRQMQIEVGTPPTPVMTLPCEHESFHEAVVSLEDLLERVRQAAGVLYRVMQISGEVEKSLGIESRKVSRIMWEFDDEHSHSSSPSSVKFRKNSEPPIESLLATTEEAALLLGGKMKMLAGLFNSWQIRKWEEKVFNEEETIKLLESSLLLARARQESESEKAGLSDFTMPQEKMACFWNEQMAAVSYQSIEKKNKTDNQDRFFYSVSSNATYFGVCDGHGIEGHLVAEAISDTLPQILEAAISELDHLSVTALMNAVRQAFIQMDEELVKYPKSGSTLCCVIQTSLGYLFANIGDSRAILDLQGKALQFTADQCTNDPYFVETVKKRGAKVARLSQERNGPLRVLPACTMITSDMGNHHFETNGVKHLTCSPEITFLPKEDVQSGDSYLIIASDGLWNYVNSDQAVASFRKRLAECSNLQTVAQELAAACYHAGKNRFCDDTTVMIVGL